MNTQKFIQISQNKHNNKYDYSKSIYTKANDKIVIICQKHGEFQQRALIHYRGSGCPKCHKEKFAHKSNTKDFVKKCKKVHKNTYDYSKTKYSTSDSVVTIICKKHGEFQQRASHHLSGSGCKKCSRRSSAAIFIKKAKTKHHNKYDYSKVNYFKSNKKISIICPEHGNFRQTPNSHLNGSGCPSCQYKVLSKKYLRTTEDFIKKAKKKHKNKYSYSKIKYKGCFSKIRISCKKHGEFWQTPAAHLVGSGCLQCSNHISKMEEKWLNINKVPKGKLNRQVIIKIGKKKYIVDGFIKKTNTIYEFYGDFWHGNPKKFKPNAINIVNKKPFRKLFQETIERGGNLRKAGYNLITIWESDFKKLQQLP